MSRRSTWLLTLAALALALPAGLAASCEPTTSENAIPAGELYVVGGQCGKGCLLDLYVYEESNGLDGLQRADKIVDDTCSGIIQGDRIVL